MKKTIRLLDGSFRTVEVSITWQKEIILTDIRAARAAVNDYQNLLQGILKHDRSNKLIQEAIEVTEHNLQCAKNELQAHKRRLLTYIAK